MQNNRTIFIGLLSAFMAWCGVLGNFKMTGDETCDGSNDFEFNHGVFHGRGAGRHVNYSPDFVFGRVL